MKLRFLSSENDTLDCYLEIYLQVYKVELKVKTGLKCLGECMLNGLIIKL